MGPQFSPSWRFHHRPETQHPTHRPAPALWHVGPDIVVSGARVISSPSPHFCPFCMRLTRWTQCLYYGLRYSVSRAVCMLLSLLVLIAAFEVGLVYAVRVSRAFLLRGNAVL
jgi:hypothetical protein